MTYTIFAPGLKTDWDRGYMAKQHPGCRIVYKDGTVQYTKKSPEIQGRRKFSKMTETIKQLKAANLSLNFINMPRILE